MEAELLEKTCKEDVLTYGYTYVNLPTGAKWQHRKWAEAIYNAGNPFLVKRGLSAKKVSTIKSTQSGLTTAGIVKLLHAMTEYKLSIAYTLPRLQDVQDIDKSKLGPIIRNSPYIRDKIGNVDTTTNKEIGGAFLYLMHLTTEPRMLSADFVINDEIDLSDPNNLAVVPNRMDASDWKISLNYSTPTVAGYGIDALYKNSSQHEWLVPCPHCGKWEQLDWKKNIRVKGYKYKPDSVAYICSRCEKDLPLKHIQGAGEWVAQNRKMIDYHLGYHVSQMMIYSANDMWGFFIDPESSLQEFYRKRLGIPFTSKDTSLSEEWLKNNIPKDYNLPDGKYFLGVDQKNIISLVVTRRKGNIIEIVDAWEDDGEFEEVVQRAWKKYPIAGTVIDADPNRNTASKLAKSRKITWIADYHHSVKNLYTVSNEFMLTILRSQAFDDLFERLGQQEIFFGHSGGPLPNIIKVLFKHLSNMKRDVEEKRTLRGDTEQKVFWRSIGSDDLSHALLYSVSASELVMNKSAKDVRVSIPLFKKLGEGEEGEEDEKDDKPKRRVLRIR